MSKTKAGIHFPVQLRKEVWRAELRVAARNYSTYRWHLGDLLAHAEMADYGKTYDLAIAETGLGYQTIANLKSVAKRVELSRRRESLSFGHHAEIAGLIPEEQDRLLRLAEKNHWTRSVLRGHVQTLSDAADDEPLPPGPVDKPQITEAATPPDFHIKVENGSSLPIPQIKHKEVHVDPAYIRALNEKFRPFQRMVGNVAGSEPEKATLDAAHRELRNFLTPWLETFSAAIGRPVANHFRQGLRMIEQRTKPRQRKSRSRQVRCTDLGAAPS